MTGLACLNGCSYGCEECDPRFSSPLRYRTIVADPPWDAVHNTGGRKNGGRRGAPMRHYNVMSTADIAGLNISERCEPNAHLYLWVMNSNVAAGWQIACAWGFRPLTMLTWCKRQPGVGHWFRNNTEHVLFCTRGTPLPRQYVPPSTWFVWPRGRHSEKPDAFYDLVEQVSPGPYLELFARRSRFGWDSHGDQSLHDIDIARRPA